MKKKKAIHPVWIVLALILFFPVGLVLLGAQENVQSFFKVSIALCYGLLLIFLFQQYQFIPRTNQAEPLIHEAEQVKYSLIKVEYPLELINGAKEIIQKPEYETWIQIFIEVTNIGKKKIYYISLMDNPLLIFENGSVSPDLSLSFEPFGDIAPNITKTGYLVFRLLPHQKAITFQIASYTASLQ